MTKIYEIKDKVLRFCSEYETYLKYAWKFVIALLLFGIINGSIGFMEKINGPFITIALSLLCCMLPLGATLVIAAGLVVVHLYVLAAEVALMAVLVFAVVFLLYFRFSPHDTLLFMVTPLLCVIGIPYVVPISAGLLRKGHSAASIVSGTIVYYFLNGVYKNVAVLQAIAAGEDIEGAKMSVAAGQLLENTELYLMLTVFTISTLLVYTIRKMAIKYAWTIAIVTGVLVQITGLLVGYIWFNITEKVVGMLIGNILAAGIAFGIEFLFMNLDYMRTERVQFEDDDYYYFVKAVPKKLVTSSEKVITEFGGLTGFAHRMKARKEAEEKITRKNIADELEIDEELLK
ncbi:MAG: hypothetical protein IJF60_07040 [Agathobacter sp.]|nr:hypothetical protein [Agathobacter sp.]